ncbi:cytochrome P450 [Epithele typhae]|uniref:cytochrome P450 n=1 Tax=Epithele typhae TaxID=378194 RepID=UPI002007FBD9|nr:cytochrome P450 [Epithele typhae]KAH9921236.1 cytochrome P450 [Epithele typhae]
MSTVNVLQPITLAITLIAAVGLASFVRPYLRTRTLASKLPPGPPSHWLIGNQQPPPYAHRYYTELAKTYGPVFTLRYGSRIVCVIAGHQAALDIMVQQAPALADRPRHVAADELVSRGMRVLLVGAGARLRRLRAALHAALQPASAPRYERVQGKAARQFVRDVAEDPARFAEHARRYAATVILTVTYGKTTPTSYGDMIVQEINRNAERLMKALVPGAYLVDSYPILKHVPGFTSELDRFHREELDLYTRQVDTVRRKVTANSVQPCFVTYLLDNQEKMELSDDELAYLAGSMFGAGSDTTAGVLTYMVMAAALYPDAQRWVQNKLDAVVGRDRAPTFSDQDRLPEIWAFAEELYRWRPLAPQGFTHRATQDVVWKDYVIPAGAEVVGCHWAIGRDEEVFDDPEEFRPERWLDAKGQMRDDIRSFNFGFGRRVCPGQHLAERSVFINLALALWAFEISEDPTRPIDSLAVADAALSHPLPFAAQFKPRVASLTQKLSALDVDDG